MRNTKIYLFIISLIVLVSSLFGGVQSLLTGQEAEPTPSEVFHSTGVQLYEDGLLEAHFQSCRIVASDEMDQELADDCLKKARLMNVFTLPYEPLELHYVYPRDAGTEVSQTPRKHYYANGIWATDVSTGGVPMKMYAPDIRNKKITYTVSYEDNYMEHYGRALKLTSTTSLERFTIGHIDGVVAGTVTTGEYIGTTTMEGITTGYHAHIEYETGVKSDGRIIWNQTEYKIDPNYNAHQAILNKTEKKNVVVDNRIAQGIVKFTSYNPKCNQTKGGIEGEDGGCYATPQAPCAVGSLKGKTEGFCGLPYSARGVNLRDLYRDGENPIALSLELREKFGRGNKVLVTPINSDIAPFIAVISDALDVVYDGLLRGDLYKEDMANNMNFNATVTPI